MSGKYHIKLKYFIIVTFIEKQTRGDILLFSLSFIQVLYNFFLEFNHFDFDMNSLIYFRKVIFQL